MIAYNTDKGIFVEAGAGHRFYSNSIFSNSGLGIGFNTGSSPNSNDQCDTDTGSNWGQNYPVLSYASSNETLTRINGRYNSYPNTQFVVEFFANNSCDISRNGEGKTFIGRINVTTGSNCLADLNAAFPVPRDVGAIITATATNLSNNSTSEFSACLLSKAKPFDFDGDGKSDVSVFRPDNGVWYLLQSTNGFAGVQFGADGDVLVPADYDGDGKTDEAVFRSGTWYLNRSQSGFTGIAFGASDDVPVPADYDGDGKADVAVFRPSNGTWYLLRSTLGFTAVQFGDSNDKLVPADYDGDGKTDVAVFRPSNGVWYLLQTTAGFTSIAFGFGNDTPVAADYDGDGRADVAVFRPLAGAWYLNRSQAGFTGVAFGAPNATPVPNAFVR